MNRKQRYYGIAGKNGYGVFNDYEKPLISEKYLRSSQVKNLMILTGQKSGRWIHLWIWRMCLLVYVEWMKALESIGYILSEADYFRFINSK